MSIVDFIPKQDIQQATTEQYINNLNLRVKTIKTDKLITDEADFNIINCNLLNSKNIINFNEIKSNLLTTTTINNSGVINSDTGLITNLQTDNFSLINKRTDRYLNIDASSNRVRASIIPPICLLSGFIPRIDPYLMNNVAPITQDEYTIPHTNLNNLNFTLDNNIKFQTFLPSDLQGLILVNWSFTISSASSATISAYIGKTDSIPSVNRYGELEFVTNPQNLLTSTPIPCNISCIIDKQNDNIPLACCILAPIVPYTIIISTSCVNITYLGQSPNFPPNP